MDPRVARLSNTSFNLQNATKVVEDICPLAGVLEPMEIKNSSVQWVLPPFNTFHWLLSTNPRMAKIHLGTKDGGVQDFWEGLKASNVGQEFWALHPWLGDRTPASLKYHLPVMVFDDSGPFSNTASTYVRVFYSLVGCGSDKQTRILLSTGLTQQDLPDLSWGPILSDFERLAAPVPAGSWGAMLLFFGADLEYICNVLGLKHYNSTDGMCSLCLANSTGMVHNNYQKDAPWTKTFVDDRTFGLRARRPLHPVVEHGFFNRFTFRYDLLHMLDHHGLASHVAANVLWTHLSGERECDALPGENIEARLDFLNQDIKAYYRQQRVQNRLPVLKVSNIKSGEWPELKGNNTKAANTKALVPYILELQKRAVQLAPTQKNRHMLKVAESLMGAYNIFVGANTFLSADEAAALEKHLQKLGHHYQWLGVHAFQDEHLPRWKTVPKCHYVVGHLAWQAKLINPRWVQGYCSESMVGTLAEMYGKTATGPYHRTVQLATMTKYRMGMRLLWDPTL